MKHLLKIAIVVIAARLLVHTPKGTSEALDNLSSITLRDVAVQVDNIFIRVQEAFRAWLS
ncbi:MAG: hypothetical protein ACAI34_12025 [Verrucomicrobium sp.]|nr:hypothetical protein [Verrucomicrobium sp.]